MKNSSRNTEYRRRANRRAHKRDQVSKPEWLKRCKEVLCADCGEEYPHYVLEFDHVRGDKLFTLSGRTAASKTWTQLHEERNKCDVVCANCHKVRTWSRQQLEETVV
jgi:hypothetical protein